MSDETNDSKQQERNRSAATEDCSAPGAYAIGVAERRPGGTVIEYTLVYDMTYDTGGRDAVDTWALYEGDPPDGGPPRESNSEPGPIWERRGKELLREMIDNAQSARWRM